MVNGAPGPGRLGWGANAAAPALSRLCRGAWVSPLCCPLASDVQLPPTPLAAPGLHGKVVRDFLRDYGIKQRALEAGVLQELSKEEAEADIIQRGALVGMALR